MERILCIGEACLNNNRLETGIKLSEEILPVIEKNNTSRLLRLKSRILLNLAKGQYQTGNRPEALSTLNTACHCIKKLPQTKVKADLLIALSRAFKKTGGGKKNKFIKKKRFYLLKEAEKIGRKTGDRAVEANALGYLGELYAEDNRLDEALGFIRRAVFTAQLENIPAAQYLWQWKSEQILKKKASLKKPSGH